MNKHSSAYALSLLLGLNWPGNIVIMINNLAMIVIFNINPITYSILTFRQLFGLDPENKVTVNGLIWNVALIMVWMILVNMKNFKFMALLLLEIWCHKNFLSIMEQVIAIRYLPPGFKQNSTKITFYAWKHLFWHKVFCISIVFKQKQKFHRFNFSRRLISKTTAVTPLMNWFC